MPFPLLVMCSQTQSFLLSATRSCGGLVPWKTQIASALGFSSCPSARVNGYVDAHGCYKFNNADLALGPHDTTADFPVFSTPTSGALTVSRAANKLSRGAWNVKPPSMSVDNAAEDSPSLLPPDVLVPPLRENTQWVQSSCRGRSLGCTSLLGLTQAFYMESMKQMRAKLHNKIT